MRTKKHLLILFLSFVSAFMILSCLPQEARVKDQKPATPSAKKQEGQAPVEHPGQNEPTPSAELQRVPGPGVVGQVQRSPKPPVITTGEDITAPQQKQTQQFVVRVKTKKKVDFSGVVTQIDPQTATLSIRNMGKTISFDMSSPILIGYQNTREIKNGDVVSVGYTPFGLQIRKGVSSITHPEPAVKAEKVITQKKAIVTTDTTKSRKNSPIRMKESRNPTSFQDVDNNKDGKITPIELCVMIPDMTIQKFKEFDKNGDGCLNESEFRAIKK